MSAHAGNYGFEAAWTQRPPRIYIDPASNNAAAILQAFPAEVAAEPGDADLLWVRSKPRTWYPALQPLQALNHIPGQGVMTRKANLAETLARYHATQPAGGLSHVDFMPSTYRLSDPADRAALMARLPAEDSPDNLWILKPSDLSEGRGIQIVWRFDWLRKALREDGGLTFRYEGKPQEYVIQRYIRDVLLLDGRKSELRVYWLIASLDPLLVLMYPEGFVRLASQPFRLSDFSNPRIHIANASRQRGPDGRTVRDVELKWDFARLHQALEKRGAPADFVERGLPEALKPIFAYVVCAALDSLRTKPPDGFFFGLYGADFILDRELTPWLTEIQRFPGLNHDHPVNRRVVPPMLRGAVGIVLEVLARTRRGEYPGVSNTHGFQWVIRET